MIQILEVARRWQVGQSLREIARETGLDRETVRRDCAVLEPLVVACNAELDDALVHQVASRVQTRAVPEPSTERVLSRKHRERIATWLPRKKPPRPTKVHALLARDHGVDVSYATQRRFAMDELGWGVPKPTGRVADAPAGEKAQVDFGKTGDVYDVPAARTRPLYALVVTLCFSRYQFVWPAWEQTTAAVREGLDEAWRFFGGVLGRIVPDNVSAMVSKTDPLAPPIVDAFAN